MADSITGMTDTLPTTPSNCPPSTRNTVRHPIGTLSAIISESCPSSTGARNVDEIVVIETLMHGKGAVGQRGDAVPAGVAGPGAAAAALAEGIAVINIANAWLISRVASATI
jgi:hypothetical protein